MSEKITILHIDDHPVFCYGIETLINAQPDMLIYTDEAHAFRLSAKLSRESSTIRVVPQSEREHGG